MNDITIDLEGRLVIKDEETNDVTDPNALKDGKHISFLGGERKRKRETRGSERDNVVNSDTKDQSKRRKRQNENTNNKAAAGSEFKAKKGTGGDVQKGKLLPYAYLPLDHRFLNRKKKRDAPRQYSNIVKAGRENRKKNNRNTLRY